MSRKGRIERSLSRRKAFRTPAESVLIVCEGGRTEPRYFETLCKKWRLNSREIREVDIHGDDCGSAPINVVNRAIELRNKRKELSRKSQAHVEFDQVWVVYDRNSHTTFEQANCKARDNKLLLATSDPCFELWYLLHFGYYSGPFTDCTDVIRRLKHYKPEYEKISVPFCDDEIEERLDTALKNAHTLRELNLLSALTDVDKLVIYLQKMKRSK
ncbi:MAG: RloB family protein [bacterium]|nr:RloB family protein [bacterium]